MVNIMTSLFKDIRYGFRALIKSPCYTLIAILTLGIGIGANTTIFTAINAFFLRPLPYEASERLVDLQERHATFGGMSTAYANYQDWRDRNKSFEEMACYRGARYNRTGVDRAEVVSSQQVTANLFPILGVKPIAGRAFEDSDISLDAERTVVLSYGYWQEQFEGSKDALGQKLLFDGLPYTVIGVMPVDFIFPPFRSSSNDVWTPMELLKREEWFLNRNNHAGSGSIGKLKAGISLAQAQTDMDSIALQLQEEYPDNNSGCTVQLTNYQERITRNIKPGLMLLMGAVFFVLLIVSANIGNLLMIRASARNQEFAVRSALGAGRMQIIRQILCEGMILVCAGGLAGLLFSLWASDLIIRIIPNQSLMNPDEFFRIDTTVLLFSCGITLGAGLLLSMVPAWQSSRINVNDAMKETSRSSTGGMKRKRYRELLIISEISLALMLLVGAGLMMRSFVNYLNADPGYNPRNVVKMDLSLTEHKYPEDAQTKEFYRSLLQRVNAIPGVQHASLSSNILGQWQSTYYVEHAPIPEPGQNLHAEFNVISADHFNSMGIRLIEGRYFNQHDVEDSKQVVIVDERFAQKWWPDQSAVGKRLAQGGPPSDDDSWREVVGVVRHIKHYGVDQNSRESVYLPFEQRNGREFTLVVRTKGEPMNIVNPIRHEIALMDNELPVAGIQTLMDINIDRSNGRRFFATLLGTFALTALFLAALGIYGVISYSVAQRSHEIGIRMAMGAKVSDVLWLVLKKGLSLAGIGVFVGLLGSLALHRFISSQLFGVSGFDPITYISVSILLIAVALVACYLPARKATKVDPMVTLRCE